MKKKKDYYVISKKKFYAYAVLFSLIVSIIIAYCSTEVFEAIRSMDLENKTLEVIIFQIPVLFICFLTAIIASMIGAKEEKK